MPMPYYFVCTPLQPISKIDLSTTIFVDSITLIKKGTRLKIIFLVNFDNFFGIFISYPHIYMLCHIKLNYF